MNGGETSYGREASPLRASFHADVRGLCGLGTPSEPPPSSGRSEASTLPYTDAYADTLAAPTTLGTDQPDWCVDTGGPFATMTTFELWEALERGEVLAWMRIWREGMECWTPVGEIPEFAWAIAGTPAPPADPELVSLPDPAVEPPPDSPLPTAVTPAPAPASSVRPTAAPQGARWIAAGSAVALAAVIMAILARNEPPPPPPVASAGSEAPAEVMTIAPPAPADPPTAEAAHHDERGQRRLPRAGRRAYGR